jgi:hypothetical protein
LNSFAGSDDPDKKINFNSNLGWLQKGQEIIVAIGAGAAGNSAYDGYKISFTIGMGVQSALRSLHQRTVINDADP